MKQFYTYLHCKPDGSPFYVGKGSDTKKGRRSHNFSNGRNTYHKNIVAKYGKEAILIYVFPCEDEKQAFLDENQQIAQLRSEGVMLVNATSGGEGYSSPKSKEWRENMSKIMKGRVGARIGMKNTDECNKKISIALMGNKSRAGLKHSAETIEKMKKSQIGNKNNLGKKMSDETKAKISAAHKGRSIPWSPARRAAYEKRNLA